MKVEILMIGRISEKPYKALIDQYLERLRGRLSVDITPCRDDNEMEKRLDNREWIVALDEHGKEPDSAAFSNWINERIKSGISRVTFCLGGATGLPNPVRKVARETFALSKLTLNHQLALLTLAEQLYRGVSILFGEPYHKA
ncbi:MAG: 23S rRNA (pseudouridine(1915)-N(3))-methyltransferase RlmH [Candidatus Riflebacteria bacterium]|nr:23S rRNA (pseudouridine(1915)-N(3))-methyltransferase RlmH [Candidatus Riflebacteria bacterium]